MWLHKRTKQLKPVIRNVMTDPKMEPDLLFYFQNVDDVLDHCVEVSYYSHVDQMSFFGGFSHVDQMLLL